jgi:hypothetical protein
VEKGVGGLLSPWQIKREGLAQLEVRRAEVVALAAAERDAQDIRSGRARLLDVAPQYSLMRPKLIEMEPQNSSATPVELPEPIKLATRTSVADAIHREVNVAKAVALAEEVLKDDPQAPPDRTIEEDWLFRWRDYAGEVSSEQLQQLWGKVLAGEVKSPGTYSLRALDFLRNLSLREAQDIARLSRFVFGGVLARSQQDVLAAEGITTGFLVRMQELGVVSGVESRGLEKTYESSENGRFVQAFCSHGRCLIVTHEDPARTLKLQVYKLTEVGEQVMRLGTFAAHEGYLRGVGAEIKQKGFAVALGSYREVSANSIQVFDEETL